MQSKLRVFVVGTGGREKALMEAIQKSPLVAAADVVAVALAPVLIETAKKWHIDLLVVGPEQPLVEGVVDEFARHAPEIRAFGPSKLAAQLEGSKIFMKSRCKRWGIPTADFDFTGYYAGAKLSIKQKGFRVIKADGLASGKGVEVTSSEEEALSAAHRWLTKGPIVMEERLEGVECSVMALCDGVQSMLLPTARDYKRAYDGDAGPNTGGMGAYAPSADVSPAMLTSIKVKIIDVLLARMEEALMPYHGVLYAGIMLTKDGPKLLEVNCRFGDPECQAVLPLVEGDIVPYLLACTEHGGLSKLPPLQWKGGAAVCVCLADKDYPARGSRRQSIVGTGRTVAEAREVAYRKVASVPGIENFHYRKDIAAGV